MKLNYEYEIVKVGEMPTWAKDSLHSFRNPIAAGDKVKPNGIGTDLLKVVAVEHYQECSVLYCE